MDCEKFLNRENSEPDIDSDDVIKGRRLTNSESMRLMFPDLPLIDDKVLD